jgi:hypothetical protein
MTVRPTVGFIGIGKMGWPMASRLAPHHDLIVSDASDRQVEEFLGAFKARKADDNAALARESDVVVLMLPTSAIVEQVMAGPTGVRAGLRPGRCRKPWRARESHWSTPRSPGACPGRRLARWLSWPAGHPRRSTR